MLENFNHSPRLSKKVRIMDEEQVRRKPLGKFAAYLEVENTEKRFFICREKIENETPASTMLFPGLICIQTMFGILCLFIKRAIAKSLIYFLKKV